MKKLFVFALLLAVLACPSVFSARADAGALTAGDTVYFGKYLQNTGNEPIEWTVLEVRDEKALLLSCRILDAKWYFGKNESVTWEESGVRLWLNDEFLNTAFTKAERSAILKTEVDNGDSQGYPEYTRSHGGNNTQDYVFLLSWHEAFEVYFTEDGDRLCTATDCAIARGADCPETGKPGCWLLRSPGNYQSDVLCVTRSGARRSLDANHGSVGIRPAIWVDTSSKGFKPGQAPAQESAVPEGTDLNALLKGTWFGFESCDEWTSYESVEFRMLRFDPEKGRLDMLINSGYYPELASGVFRVSGNTLYFSVFYEGEEYDEEYADECRLNYIDGKLILERYGLCAYSRVEDGCFPDDFDECPFTGENMRFAIHPLEDGSLAISYRSEAEEETVEIPSSAFGFPITAVADSTFSGSESIKHVIIPDGITSIGEYAFSSMPMLEDIRLPDTLKTIGYGSFQYCESLSEIVIPEGTVSIGEDAFTECVNLVSATLPQSLKDIGENVFYGEYTSRKTVFTVRSGSPAESFCRENRYKFLALDKKGKVVADERINVHVSYFMYDGFYSLYGLFEAGETALEEGLDPENVVKEMRAIAKENGVLDYFETACANIASEDGESRQKLLDFPDRDYRSIYIYDTEGLEDPENLGFSVYETLYVSDEMKEALSNPKAEYCVEPFFWTESDFKDFYGTDFSKFKPSSPRPGYICVVVKKGAKAAYGLNWDAGDSLSYDFMNLLGELVNRFHVGILTGNPQLASSFWVFDVSFPFYAYYGEHKEVKGYNCKVSLTVLNASDHNKAAEFTYTNVLEDTIYDWDDGVAQADLPSVYDMDEKSLTSFLNKVTKYIANQKRTSGK